jgi:hypothetical protein
MKTSDGRREVPPGDDWESGTWEGAARATLRRSAAMTFRERLQWLEEATRLAVAFSQAPHSPLSAVVRPGDENGDS